MFHKFILSGIEKTKNVLEIRASVNTSAFRCGRADRFYLMELRRNRRAVDLRQAKIAPKEFQRRYAI
jgi:hypothetical protein